VWIALWHSEPEVWRGFFISISLTSHLRGESQRFFRQVSKPTSWIRRVEKLQYFIFDVGNFSESPVERRRMYVLLMDCFHSDLLFTLICQ